MSFKLAQNEVYDFLPSVLPAGYEIADEWDDSRLPFSDLSNRIAVVSQTSGAGPADRYTRSQDLEVWVFTQADPSGPQVRDARDHAQISIMSLLKEFKIGVIKNITILGDVSGPFRTGNGRRYFKFDIRCLVTNTVIEET